jgi:Peptidase family M28
MVDSASAHARSPEFVSSALREVRDRRVEIVGVIGLLVLAALVGLAWMMQRPPPPMSSAAPTTEFSADRALEHLERITGDQPTPIGSAGSDAIRDYLVAELAALGFDAGVQEGVGVSTGDAGTVAGRVSNVVATLPGRDSTGRVVLSAHYDTTFGSPGAADDKASVAAILETARALTRGDRLRNDVVVLLTDGEEPGLLGAASFSAQHSYGAEGGVLLNWEASGNRGPAVLFETSPGNADLIAEFAASAPHPAGDSSMAAAYRAGSQNTDFTVLTEGGFVGLNFAFIDGVAAYHHSRDTVANFDPASLQHLGANMLGLTRGFANRDLAGLDSGHDATYFTVFGQVIAYPAWLVWPLACVALLAVLTLAVVVRRQGLATVPRLLAAIVAGVIPLLVAPAAAIGLWEALVRIRPGYAAMFMGDPYRPQFYRWALAALAAAVLLSWYLVLRRRMGAVPLVVGALFWPAVFGLVTAWLFPGAAYIDALAATAAAAGGLLALVAGERRPGWQAVALTAGAIPGVVLYVLSARTLLGALGIAVGAAGVLQFMLAGLVALPLIGLAIPPERAGSTRPIVQRPSFLIPLLAALASVALTGLGLMVDRFDRDHPQSTHLLYALDAGSSTARWATEDRLPHDWVADYVPERNSGGVSGLPLPYGTEPRWTGAAQTLPAQPPQLDMVNSRTNGNATVLELRATSARDADVLVLHTDRPVEAATITVDGQPSVTSQPDYPNDVDSREWPYELRFYDPPPEGITVTLRVRGTEPLRISLSDYTVGLDGIPGFAPRPPDLDRSPDRSSDLVIVGRIHHL